MAFMRRVTVTNEEKARIQAHLDKANTYLEILRTYPDASFAGPEPDAITAYVLRSPWEALPTWIQTAASLLLMLDAKIDTPQGEGLLMRTYQQLATGLEAIDRDDYGYEANLRQIFGRCVATFQVVVDSIDIAPDALFVTVEGNINPYFPAAGQETQRHQVGVLMPFEESWSNRIWNDHLKPIVEGLPIDPPAFCLRADNLYGHDVLHDIYHMIETSHAVIADITGRNPNVFYELGIAHNLGKRVILLTQEVDDIPFDLQRYRFIIYEDNSDGYKVLKAGLESALLEAFA